MKGMRGWARVEVRVSLYVKCYCLILGSKMGVQEVSWPNPSLTVQSEEQPGEWRLELSGFRRDKLPIFCSVAISFLLSYVITITYVISFRQYSCRMNGIIPVFIFLIDRFICGVCMFFQVFRP